jgi:uncharacterized protein YbbC (DUF1343 family)/CubicO group peptidase (beta-lactamase class C family)
VQRTAKQQKSRPAVEVTGSASAIKNLDKVFRCFAVLTVFYWSVTAGAEGAPPLQNPAAFTRLPDLVTRDLREGQIPGAVILIGSPEQVLFSQSFGSRALLPNAEAMTTDTLFDLASLTKVIATTTAVLQLVESSRLQLDKSVAQYWPAFAQNGKDTITVRQLLTHYSGLRADLPLPTKQPWQGYREAMARIEQLDLKSPPGSTYLYSDVNFLALGELVQRISGESLADYCEHHIFAPLQMRETRFLPPDAWRERIAPTLADQHGQLRGIVHDPTARRMGGIAGHAGLFASAADLSRFARMLLNDGELDGARILKPETIASMQAPQSPAGKEKLRGLGWDLAAPFAPNRLALPMLGAFGHTGYTGTSLWIDPINRLYSIILTNRVHPNDRAKIQSLREDIAVTVGDAVAPVSSAAIAHNLTATPLLDKRPDVATGVATGLDVLANQQFGPLTGKRVGLITNHSGRDQNGVSTVDLLRTSKTVKLVALFSPEHGLEGILDNRVDSGIDARSQLPVYSLYGKTLRPTPDMLKNIDALVFDIQDAGARFYTYISTMGYAMEAAANAGIDFYVLDRPNPIGAHRIQGPMLDADLKSFTAYFELPVSHGMTVAELARLFNIENHINARLRVVPMQGYRRDLWFDQTGLNWVNPSPNLRSLVETILYPGVAIIEGANVSVGRGTQKPFELFGAPWIDGVKLARYLRQRKINGVTFTPVRFTPTASLYQGKLCHGVRINLVDREQLDAPLLGIELASALQRFYAERFDLNAVTGMIGSRSVVEAIRRGDDPRTIAQSWQTALFDFEQMRKKYLLY